MVSVLRMRGGSLVALSVLVSVIGGSAGAAEVFSTFGPGDSYGSGGYMVYSVLPGFFSVDQDMGDRFIVSGTQSYTLDSIELALDYAQFPGTGPTNVVDVWLMTDVLAFPGTDLFHRPGDIIEALTLDVSLGNRIVAGNSALHPVLNPDTNYWIGVSIANGYVGTLYSSPVVTGWHTYRRDSGVWSAAYIGDTATLDAFRINGTPVTAAIPAPGAILLCVIGTALVAGLIRRKML